MMQTLITTLIAILTLQYLRMVCLGAHCTTASTRTWQWLIAPNQPSKPECCTLKIVDIDRKAADANSGCVASPAPSRRWERGSRASLGASPRGNRLLYLGSSSLRLELHMRRLRTAAHSPAPTHARDRFQTATHAWLGPSRCSYGATGGRTRRRSCATSRRAPSATLRPRGAHAVPTRYVW